MATQFSVCFLCSQQNSRLSASIPQGLAASFLVSPGLPGNHLGETKRSSNSRSSLRTWEAEERKLHPGRGHSPPRPVLLAQKCPPTEVKLLGPPPRPLDPMAPTSSHTNPPPPAAPPHSWSDPVPLGSQLLRKLSLCYAVHQTRSPPALSVPPAWLHFKHLLQEALPDFPSQASPPSPPAWSLIEHPQL